jgi:hypothetical protein
VAGDVAPSRSHRLLVATLLAGVLATLIGLGATAHRARADGTDPAYPGSSVHVKVTGPRQQGKTLTIVATGTNAPDSLPVHISYGLEVILVDPSILKGPCRVSYEAELTDIDNNPKGGRLLTFDQLNEGDDGAFQIPLRFTPGGFGPLLVCVYSMYITDDAAYGSTEVQIAPPKGHGHGGAKPHNTGRPRIERSGARLTCTRGRWTGHPTSYRYRWRVGSGGFTAGRGAHMSIPGKLHGRTIACQVTASNAAGHASRTSKPFKVH